MIDTIVRDVMQHLAVRNQEETVMKDYPDSGALFKNDRARSDKDPGYNGNGDVTCPKCGGRFEFYLSAWLKVAKSGAKYFSLKFKPKGSETRSDRPAVGDDEVPF